MIWARAALSGAVLSLPVLLASPAGAALDVCKEPVATVEGGEVRLVRSEVTRHVAQYRAVIPKGEQVDRKAFVDALRGRIRHAVDRLGPRGQVTCSVSGDDLTWHFETASGTSALPRLDVAPGTGKLYSPLVLSFVGGTAPRLARHRVGFDLDGDGSAEWTYWVGPKAGLLARDLDGDGRIGDGRELFGDAVARDGFAALAALDADGSGRIDRRDPAFGELLIWFDRNGDARSDAGELLPLSRLGIVAPWRQGRDPGPRAVLGPADLSARRMRYV